jgi:hypothetical protein
MNPKNLQQQIDERCPCFAKPLNECDCQFNNETEQTMNKLSQEIAKEVDCLKKDLKDTKGQDLDPKNPEHKRILGNIVANEKAYRARFGGVS